MKPDYRVISPKRIPARLPITQTIVTAIAVNVFEIESPWTYVIAAVLAAVWVVIISMKIVQRKIDPFDFTM